jgi:hypothetical protein
LQQGRLLGRAPVRRPVRHAAGGVREVHQRDVRSTVLRVRLELSSDGGRLLHPLRHRARVVQRGACEGADIACGNACDALPETKRTTPIGECIQGPCGEACASVIK